MLPMWSTYLILIRPLWMWMAFVIKIVVREGLTSLALCVFVCLVALFHLRRLYSVPWNQSASLTPSDLLHTLRAGRGQKKNGEKGSVGRYHMDSAAEGGGPFNSVDAKGRLGAAHRCLWALPHPLSIIDFLRPSFSFVAIFTLSSAVKLDADWGKYEYWRV